MRLLSMSLLAALTVLAASNASAQSWGRGRYPEAGACFYEDINFGGRYFCTRVGEGSERVPSNLNDEISSIRLIGNAEVIVFRDGSMRGEARRFTAGVRDMRNSGFNDRLTLNVVLQPRGYGTQGRGYDNGAWMATVAAVTAPATPVVTTPGVTTTGAIAAITKGVTGEVGTAGRTSRPPSWCSRRTAVYSAVSPTGTHSRGSMKY